MASQIVNGAVSTHSMSSTDQNSTPDRSPAGHSEEAKSAAEKMASCSKENKLTLLTILSVVAGVGLGFVLRAVRTWTPREVMYVNFPGEIFLNMLRCLVLPLIASSMVSALGSLDVRLTGKIGLRCLVYYLVTTVIAIQLGILLVVSIRPGDVGSVGSAGTKKDVVIPSLTEDSFMDLIRNLFPRNIIEACIAQFSTVLIRPANQTARNDSIRSNTTEGNSTTDGGDDYRKWKFKRKMLQRENILGVLTFCVVLGITLGRMKESGKPLLQVFQTLCDAMMIITGYVACLSPIGILFLVASKIISMKYLSMLAGKVGMYTMTVLLGLSIHGLMVLPIIYVAFVRLNPFVFIGNMGQALVTAFGTSSSSATLPVTIACLEDKNMVDHKVSRFVLPVGATINMDGTALYEAVATIFIAQVEKVPLDIGKIFAISITATAASVGAAGIPQAGLVTMVMVLNAVGLPADDVALVLVVDWLLDRFRTVVNVLGDSFGAAIVEKLSIDDLETFATATAQNDTTQSGTTDN